MTKISLNSDNLSKIYNLVSSAKTALNEAKNNCKSAAAVCPNSSSYGKNLNEWSIRLDESQKNINRVGKWFELLVQRNDKKNDEMESRIDKIENISIKKHDLYVK